MGASDKVAVKTKALKGKVKELVAKSTGSKKMLSDAKLDHSKAAAVKPAANAKAAAKAEVMKPAAKAAAVKPAANAKPAAEVKDRPKK